MTDVLTSPEDAAAVTAPPPAPAAPPPAVRPSLWALALRETFGRAGARVGLAWIGLLAAVAVFAPFLANSQPILARTDDGLSSPLLRNLDAVDLLWLSVPLAIVLSVLGRAATPGRRVAAIAWGVLLAVPFLFAPVVRRSAGAWWAGDYGVPIFVGIAFLTILILAAFVGLTLGLRDDRRLLLTVGGPIAVIGLVLLVFPPRPPENVVHDAWRKLDDTGKLRWAIRTPVPFGPNDRLNDVASKIGERDVQARMVELGGEAKEVKYDAYGPLPERRDLQPPSRRHWLGTTYYGEDMFARMIHACRVALTIGIISTAIAITIGVTVGGVMGYYAGWFDLLAMRLIEIIEALPRLLILLIITVSVGRNLYLMMAVIGLLGWTGDARFVRAEFLRLRKLDFVQAGIAMGLPRASILFRHMLPNGVSPVLVNASFGVAGAILLESTLSFLGLGLGPEDPSWGQLLEQARQGSAGFNWWIAVFPGLAIFLTVFSYILIGESMRDALDPRLKKREA